MKRVKKFNLIGDIILDYIKEFGLLVERNYYYFFKIKEQQVLVLDYNLLR